MKRRAFLKQSVLAALAASILPAWLKGKAVPKIPATATAVVELPTEMRFHTIWIEGQWRDDVQAIVVKMNGKEVGRIPSS